MEITVNITIKGVKHELTLLEAQKLAEELKRFLPPQDKLQIVKTPTVTFPGGHVW